MEILQTEENSNRYDIQVAHGKCSLGNILLACSQQGICAILLGDDPEELARDLQIRFPKSKLIDNNQELGDLVSKVVHFINVPHSEFTLPLDVKGTVFQKRVWQTLCTIPAGTTVSYTELAQKIGAPKAFRAVAQACAANKIAVAIPCHRVVRNNGELSGYRWGIERKRSLLEAEKLKPSV